MARDWPSFSSTTVWVRRTMRPGTVKPWTRRELVKSSWLTSGSTSSRMRPLSWTMGLKVSSTPYLRNSRLMRSSLWGTG